MPTRLCKLVRPAVASLALAGCIAHALPAAAEAPATHPTTAPAHANRLAREKSPYLLQHAHNPVDWFPWGDEAFAKAKRENKPIFLSVGYSTCHWCHVMERESFEDPAVAGLLNDGFVAIKVDREERPDVDRVYMTFVQATTGGGGWPMTVLLTPDLKPFFGGTYFPPDDRDGAIGLKTLLRRARGAWEKDHDKVVASAEDVTKAIRDFAAADPAAKAKDISADATKAAVAEYTKTFDAAHGGFGSAPKFPEPVVLSFLFRAAARSGEPAPRDMALRTLHAMAAGGVYDHLGGGFHRYSTDERWFLPHFEKMLYDQAQLASVYVEAWQVTHDDAYSDVARGVLDYVLRDLTGPDGQFYSAEDADSAIDAGRPDEKHEGAFYVWSADELKQALGPDAAAPFAYHYGVEANGNVARDPRREFTGRNVLSVARSADDTAKKFGKPAKEMEATLAGARATLLAARNHRPRPHRDDKTLAAWNGLMISAFAHAGAALQEPRYERAAIRAAAFLRDHLYDAKTHILTRRWRDGGADVPGFLDDYAFVTQAMIDLYESTLDVQWLRLALDLQAKQDALFWDAAAGGYFSAPAGDASLIVRMKDNTDGAEPAGNSIAAMNLLRLSQMTGDAALRGKADQTLRAYAGHLDKSPTALPAMLAAADFGAAKPKQIVLAGDPASPGVRAMLAAVHARYLPNRILLGADGGAGQAFLAERLPFLTDVKPVGGKPTAYVCENYACQLPTNELATFVKQLK